MNIRSWLHNHVVAAVLTLIFSGAAAFGQSDRVESLLERLKTADEAESGRIEQEIQFEWSKSGSAAMDLLLARGREAMALGDLDLAVEHLTALVDHAPDFAEGWNARAIAYYQQGQIGPALADIGKTLALNPRHFGALSGFARIMEELDRPEQALELQRAVQAIHPHAAGVSQAIDRLTAALQGRSL